MTKNLKTQNEPIKSYILGSEERITLQKEYDNLSAKK